MLDQIDGSSSPEVPDLFLMVASSPIFCWYGDQSKAIPRFFGTLGKLSPCHPCSSAFHLLQWLTWCFWETNKHYTKGVATPIVKFRQVGIPTCIVLDIGTASRLLTILSFSIARSKHTEDSTKFNSETIRTYFTWSRSIFSEEKTPANLWHGRQCFQDQMLFFKIEKSNFRNSITRFYVPPTSGWETLI